MTDASQPTLGSAIHALRLAGRPKEAIPVLEQRLPGTIASVIGDHLID